MADPKLQRHTWGDFRTKCDCEVMPGWCDTKENHGGPSGAGGNWPGECCRKRCPKWRDPKRERMPGRRAAR